MNKYTPMMMNIAKTVSEQSSAVRLKVGAVIVKDDRIISIGYNGTYSGADNTCEYTDENGNLRSKDSVIHAEMNAMLFVARSNESTVGTVMYCTHSPCENCAKHIIQAGISEVVYNERYRDDAGTKLLNDAGVKVVDLDWMNLKVKES